jgi:hypothetical protein
MTKNSMLPFQELSDLGLERNRTKMGQYTENLRKSELSCDSC